MNKTWKYLKFELSPGLIYISRVDFKQKTETILFDSTRKNNYALYKTNYKRAIYNLNGHSCKNIKEIENSISDWKITELTEEDVFLLSI